jgi:multimeric flavodoxin WrbA
MMKILIISGTPKNDGLSHRLVAGACEAAKAHGAEVEIIQTIGLSACRMCGDGWGTCRTGHRCEFGDTDGFGEFQEKIRWADGFVLITPVYWGEVSEGVKVFIDRLRRCEASKKWGEDDAEPSFFAGKSSILVASAGGGGGGITNTFVQMERAITHMGGTSYPYDVYGFFDYIAVNRWNQEYKREALMSAVAAFIKWFDNQSKPQ